MDECRHERTAENEHGLFRCLICGQIEGKEDGRNVLERSTIWNQYDFTGLADRDSRIREDEGGLHNSSSVKTYRTT